MWTKFSGIYYIHSVVQLPCLSSSKHFPHPKRKPRTHTVSVLHSPNRHASGSHPSAFCLRGLVYSGPFIQVDSSLDLPSLTCLQSSSTLWHVSVLHFFLWLKNISLHGYITIDFSIQPLMDIRPVSGFWLWWVALLWTCVYMHWVHPLKAHFSTRPWPHSLSECLLPLVCMWLWNRTWEIPRSWQVNYEKTAGFLRLWSPMSNVRGRKAAG